MGLLMLLMDAAAVLRGLGFEVVFVLIIGWVLMWRLLAV